jgi:hypothetical protein
MKFPIPKSGLVVRYSFLWSNEKAKGAIEGSKDRPCAIVVAVKRTADGDIDTIVAPIHTGLQKIAPLPSKFRPRLAGVSAWTAIATGSASTN